jgi:hypothetical protein
MVFFKMVIFRNGGAKERGPARREKQTRECMSRMEFQALPEGMVIEMRAKQCPHG